MRLVSLAHRIGKSRRSNMKIVYVVENLERNLHCYCDHARGICELRL